MVDCWDDHSKDDWEANPEDLRLVDLHLVDLGSLDLRQVSQAALHTDRLQIALPCLLDPNDQRCGDGECGHEQHRRERKLVSRGLRRIREDDSGPFLRRFRTRRLLKTD